eukprot:TRINITY_DN3460_c0_g1_i1.p1 TRINITY_DN3460_c0_g1~~TRINITY_DN3460_c0_g1_i1.p1  ORF type:complete len:953 (-),score=284.24 TRINITY_DN3460_c0_g1_i1:498-3326(-)
MEAEGSGLNPLQVAELKKAFSICDKDGNGFIDGHELRDVITLITEESPSDSELQKIMITLDKDKNGKITWDEFITSMSAWFAEEFKAQGDDTPRKRKLESSVQDRQDVHKKVKNFFQQFKEGTHERVRKMIQHGNVNLDDARNSDLDSLYRETLSSEAKLRFLEEHRRTMLNWDHIVTSFNDPFKHYEAVQCIARLFSIVEVFNSPQERRTVSEDVARVFEAFVRSNLMPFIIRAAESQETLIQFEALRILVYFIPGPRIASTPEDSLLHPNQMFFKKLATQHGVIALFISRLASPTLEIREQAVLGLGAVASYNPDARDFVLRSGVLNPLLHLINTQTPLPLLRKIAWTLSVLCGVTHPLNQLPSWAFISPLLQPVTNILFVNDEAILTTICPALSLILPGLPEIVILRRLVDILREVSLPSVQKAALKTLTNIIRFDNNQMFLLLNQCQLLPQIEMILTSAENSVKIEACEFILVLVGLKGEVIPVISTSHIVTLLVGFLGIDSLRPRAAKILKYITRTSPPFIKVLVSQGLITSLANSLTHFKSYDRVLSTMYKYSGPVFNFEFARDVLIALDNILNVGEVEVEATRQPNQFALAFDLEVIDKLGALLAAIKENPDKDAISAWRQSRPDDSSLEDKVKSILVKVSRVLHHQMAANPASKHVMSMIETLAKKYYTEPTKPEQPIHQVENTAMLVKAILGEDIRVVSLPKTITQPEMKSGFEAKFGKSPLILQYEDEEGDKVIIDSKNSLDKAINRYKDEKMVKIYLKHEVQDEDREESEEEVEETPIDSPSFRKRKQEKEKSKTLQKKNSKDEFSARKVLFTDAKAAPLPEFTFNLKDIQLGQKKRMLEQLGTTTHFGTKELETLYEKMKSQSPDLEVNREQFETALKGIGITDKLQVEQLFNAFDKSRDGKINFLEFVTGLSVVQRGSLLERLECNSST